MDDHNRARQEEEKRTLDAALARLDSGFDAERDLGLVLDGEGWHPGVIGIVASRIVERTLSGISSGNDKLGAIGAVQPQGSLVQ